MALPVGIVLFLSMTNPGYIGRFLDGIVGYALIGLCVVLLGVGSLWLKKVVQIKF
jgi:tight adherence protein B